jgi:hypothetical protein
MYDPIKELTPDEGLGQGSGKQAGQSVAFAREHVRDSAL